MTIFIHFIFGGLFPLIVILLRMFESTEAWGDKLLWYVKSIPTYCLTNTYLTSNMMSYLNSYDEEKFPEDMWELSNMRGDIYALFCHFIVWSILITIFESGFLNFLSRAKAVKEQRLAPKHLSKLDDDVEVERKRVEMNKDMNIRVDSLRKVYLTGANSMHLAVENISFGLDYGECFCLLGVNGAGKSTTFKSLTNDINITSG